MFKCFLVHYRYVKSFFFIFISSNIFIFIVLISLQSPEYSKCLPCSFLTISSTPKTFYKILNNTEDEKTSLDGYSIWCLDMAYRLDSEQSLPQSPILRAPSVYSSRLNRLPYRYSLWKSSSLLARRMTPCEHKLAMHLLMIIERICRKHNITYMLADGSLLGSLRHHDIIPWDDDIDIIIPLEDKTRFANVIEKMNETLLQYYFKIKKEYNREYYKVFLKNTPSAGIFPWNFPFVDIFLYVKNETHLWRLGQPETITKVEDVFPLIMRPFGQLWLPTPRLPRQLSNFDLFHECKGHFWDHKNEKPQNITRLKCNDLKHIYPFVERNYQLSSIEILKTNDTIIHTVIYDSLFVF